MSLIEFIGFIISFFAFIILSLRRMKERKNQPLEAYEEEEEQSEDDDEALRNYLRSIGVEVEPKRPPPPPPKPVPQRKLPPVHRPLSSPIENKRLVTNIESKSYASTIQEQRLESQVETRELVTSTNAPAYEVHITEQKQISGVDELINSLPSLGSLVIINEILGPPKAYQENKSLYDL